MNDLFILTLAKGGISILDARDAHKVVRYKWNVRRTPRSDYGQITLYLPDGTHTAMALHRMIMEHPKGMHVDHINHNGLDNRRANLRLCTHADNVKNRRLNSNSTSGYMGVGWNDGHKKWIARIVHGGKRVIVGEFDDKVEAARAWDAAALSLRGEFANLNFPDGGVGG